MKSSSPLGGFSNILTKSAHWIKIAVNGKGRKTDEDESSQRHFREGRQAGGEQDERGTMSIDILDVPRHVARS